MGQTARFGQATPEAHGERHGAYRDLETGEKHEEEQKNSRRCLLYQADNDGEWGELRFDFENGTAEIVKLADWDMTKSNIFAKTAIWYIQSLLEVRLLKEAVVMFDQAL